MPSNGPAHNGISCCLHPHPVSPSANGDLPFRHGQMVRDMSLLLCTQGRTGRVELSLRVLRVLRVYHTCSAVRRDLVAPSDAFQDKSRMRGKIIRHKTVLKCGLSSPGVSTLRLLSFASGTRHRPTRAFTVGCGVSFAIICDYENNPSAWRYKWSPLFLVPACLG